MAKDVTLLIKLQDLASRKLAQITNSTKKLEGAVKDANGRLRDAKGRFVAAGNAAKKASNGVNSLSTAVKGLFVGLSAIEAAKFVFFKTAELQTQTRSLKVLTGSLEDAEAIIKSLQGFAAITPFTSEELIDTAKRLKAFGFETDELVGIVSRLGDVAGATGADLGGIATAFGQIQAKGRLQGEELLQLQERGVDLQGTLRKEYDLTKEEFKKALESGRINAEAVSFALRKLTDEGGKYANGAIAQSDTLNGRFSTLVDNISAIARQVGKVLTPAVDTLLKSLNESLAAFNALVAASGGAALTQANIKLALPGGDAQDLLEIANVLKALPKDPANKEIAAQLKTIGRNQLDVIANFGIMMQAAGRELPEAYQTALEAAKDLLGIRVKLTKDAGTRPDLDPPGGKDGSGTGLTGMAKALADAASTSVFVNIQDQLDAQEAAGKAIAEALNEADRNAEKLGQTSDKVKTAFDGIAQTIEQGITGAIMGAIDGSKSLGESLSGILRQLAGQFISAGVGSFGGGGLLGALFPKRANGGTVQGGRSYMVGERGPELFTPGRTGSIAPNKAMGGDMNVVVNVDASGTEVQGNQGNADQLGRLIGQAVQAELIKQKRPGGLLTR